MSQLKSSSIVDGKKNIKADTLYTSYFYPALVLRAYVFLNSVLFKPPCLWRLVYEYVQQIFAPSASVNLPNIRCLL